MSHEARHSKDTFKTRLKWQDLDPDYLRQLVGLAKIEDLAGAGLANRPERLGDVTTALIPEQSTKSCALIRVSVWSLRSRTTTDATRPSTI